MTTKTKTNSNPYFVKRRKGNNLTSKDRQVLEVVCRKLEEEHGVTVLSSLFAREPDFMTFFATAYKPSLIGTRRLGDHKLAAPMGCVRVSFLCNGEVTVCVMGVELNSSTWANSITTWDD